MKERAHPPLGPKFSKFFPHKGGIFNFFPVFCTFHETHFFGKILTPIFFLKSLFIAFFFNNFFRKSEKFSKTAPSAPKNPFSGTSRQKKALETTPLAPEKRRLKPPPWRQNGRIKGVGRGLVHPWSVQRSCSDHCDWGPIPRV